MNFRAAMENRYREQTYGHRGGEEGEGEIYGESNTETYNTICKIDSQWEFAVWHRELNRGSVTRRWDGEGDEREVWEGEDMVVPMGWFLLMHDRITKFCKAIILQLKKINEVAKKLYLISVYFNLNINIHKELMTTMVYNAGFNFTKSLYQNYSCYTNISPCCTNEFHELWVF